MLKCVVLAVMGAFAASSAFAAADQPLIAPPPAWVKPATLPAKLAPMDGAAARILVFDGQAHFGDDGESVYIETFTRIQTPQGLQAAGSIQLPWDPALGDLTVHRLHILRDGKTIDVLASQKFTVLRRETNLEAATLDGALTAELQPDDLQVGDVVDMAFTLRRKDPAMAGHVDAMLAVPNLKFDLLSLRASSSDGAFRWRAMELPDGVSPAKAGLGREVQVQLTDVQPIIPPAGAPDRFKRGRQIELSDFRSWAEVSALMAPLFEQAAVITPGSPLAAQVERIKAASADPKARAQAALELVQQHVRYLALLMGDGGLVPAKAEDTWSRRFGDCKGKTALLLALLRSLGVQAQPALISVGAGDGLDQHLPSVASFDHVLVRASIGGKTYWLDGTRLGDHDLDDIEVPGFHWALPVQVADAKLEPLVQATPALPQVETTVRLDASAGISLPAPAHVETILRGDAGVATNALLNNSPSGVDKALRDYFKGQYDFIQPDKVSATFDEPKRELRLAMDGTATMDWEAGREGDTRLYETDGTGLGWKADFKRDAGPYADAPFAVDYPNYSVSREIVILPDQGFGFQVQGEDVDRIVAARAYKRASIIKDGVFTATVTQESLAPEFPASEAAADAQALTDMSKVTVYVVSPSSYRPTAQEEAAAVKGDPTDAKGLLVQGITLANSLHFEPAIAALRKAVALDSKSDIAWANLAVDLAVTHDEAGARAAIGKALAINPNQYFAYQAQGILDGDAKQYDAAIADYTRVLDLDAGQGYAREHRATAELKVNKRDAALEDLEELAREQPYRLDLRERTIRLLLGSGRTVEALAQADALVAEHADDPQAHLMRGGTLARLGRLAEANAEFEKSISIKPTAEAYLTRANFRPDADKTGKIADYTAAYALDSNNYLALAQRAELESEAKQFDKAIADASLAISGNEADVAAKTVNVRPDGQRVSQPKTDYYRVERGQIYALARQLDLAAKDFAVARAIVADENNANDWNALCWSEAEVGAQLDRALQDCEAGLKITPNAPDILDSRAFVLLRLGRYDEAVAGYGQALKLQPNLAPSLFGRGLAERAKGDAAKAKTDMDAARSIDPKIDATFADFGLDLQRTVSPGPARP